jgi:two-component system response regulator YesN
MKSSENREESFSQDGLPQVDYQKMITTLKHRMAVQTALEMIEKRMHELPTLAELASASGLSRTYFSYVFREVTGMKLQDYLMETRLTKAKDLLGRIDLKVKQVAYEIGFKDPNYFCRTFKKWTGSNPTNWRVKKILIPKNLLDPNKMRIENKYKHSGLSGY